ncbi:hypothetical protein L3Q82_010061, partial [Scortum barcoo]
MVVDCFYDGGRAESKNRKKRRQQKLLLLFQKLQMDELAALTRHQREYRECSLLLFTETWLTALTPDTAAELDGFTLSYGRTEARRAEQHCCKDIELLAVSMRPYYLPREFTHALVVVVYVPPSANADAACDVLLSAVSRLQTQGEDIDSLTHCLTDYINFCVENTVPTRTVRSFSNSKPWITPDIKALLKEKRRAFVSGNKEELKSVQRELRRMIRASRSQSPSLWETRAHTHPDTSSSHSVLCPSPPSTLPCSSLLLTAHQLWKTSCIVPVPKTPHPKELNSYRPVALTSHLMKTLERLVLAHLRPLVSSFMDPLQFAYQPDIGVDDAVIYLLHTSLTHLEKAGSTVRIMFFDFSSAFNTIQPRLLGDKLQLAGVDHHLTTWILDYLTHRPQFVRVQGFESDRLLCSTGAPQGTVLAPFLFTLYTADFSHTTHHHVISRSSLTTLLLLASSQMGTTESTEDLFRTLRTGACGTTSRSTLSYKYLGVHLNDSLDWSDNTNALVKKGNSRLFLLRRLRSFGVQGPLLRTFYDSVVASAIFYGIVCWASSITDRDRRRMDRLVRRASSVLGCPLDSVEVVGNGRMMAKLSSLLNNTSHPLQDTLTALGSSFSERLLHPRCVKE